jgi:hypothetical protein
MLISSEKHKNYVSCQPEKHWEYNKHCFLRYLEQEQESGSQRSSANIMEAVNTTRQWMLKLRVCVMLPGNI